MRILRKVKPAFWDKRPSLSGPSRYRFNYRRIWQISVLATSVVSLLPLIAITLMDYNVTQQAIESEFRLRTARIVSNAKRAISFFLTERRSALEFIVRDNSFDELSDPQRLEEILNNLRESFGGGFVDLGVIDASGIQKTYVGPYGLEDKGYSNQPWFMQVVERGVYISDVFLGYRHVPHLIIAVKQRSGNDSYYVLRASVGIGPFEDLLSNLELEGSGDAFMINQQGVLQISTRYHGKLLEKLPLYVPSYSPHTEVIEVTNNAHEDLFVGYRFIEETPFILMIVKNKHVLMREWYRTRLKLIAFLALSITIILGVILTTVTYIVEKIYSADEKRLRALHQVEYANKMASIGRMAASVAHEINNPLAIINEKAGLIRDLFALKQEYAENPKLFVLVDAITASVRRAGRITKQLLSFSRNLQASVEDVNLDALIREVLSFLEKEAEVRSIQVKVTVEDVTIIRSDRGKLQQIFLNIINNAFAAMSDGGHFSISVSRVDADAIMIRFLDDGCGIPKEDLANIFEPFFSTKTGKGGTGLGLSITYNLVQEIGGRIRVKSEVGKGTCFTIILPREYQPTQGGESYAGTSRG